MKIAVMGAGGVGGYYGARLAAAGEEVAFIARGAHLAAIRARGLRVESARGDVHIHPAFATEDAAEVGPVDVVPFAVKLWDTEAAGAAVRPLLGPGTAVISLQNGVVAEERLSDILGREHVMGGVSIIFSSIVEPGVIRHTGAVARLIFGELDGARSARAEAFLAACRRARLDVRLSTNIEKDLWEKFVYLVALSGLTSLKRSPLGPILEDPESRAMFKAAIAEAVAVARAQGVPLAPDVVETLLAMSEGLPGEVRSSMLDDLERGARLELPWLSGAVVRMGRALGVETPVHNLIVDVLERHAMGRPREG
ncbi:MAG: 2-dehydropantoate 2-reductase [Alphaproteobacteria bacterium]